MTLRLKLMVLAAALGMGACTSTQTHYYTLIAPMGAASNSAARPRRFSLKCSGDHAGAGRPAAPGGSSGQR